MHPDDKPQFVKILTGLATVKPGKQLTKEALKIYWDSMEDWSIQDFSAAAVYLARVIEFMPNPFHFEQLRKAGKPTAGEAWAKAVDHAASSAYRHGPLGNQLIDRAVRAIGGYLAIAMSEENNLHFLERRFTEHFEAMQDAEHVRVSVPQIAGPPQHQPPGGPRKVSALLAQPPTDHQSSRALPQTP